MRRTGNHAIINWVKSQDAGKVEFINNVLANENPYRYKYQNLEDHYPEHKWAIEYYRQQAKGNFINRTYAVPLYMGYKFVISPKLPLQLVPLRKS